MLALHDHVYIADVDTFILAAIDPRQVFIHFQDHNIRLIQHRAGRGIADREIEIPMLIHGRHTHDGHVHREELGVIPAQITEHHGDKIAQAPVTELAFIAGQVPAVINKVLPGRVALHHLYRLKD